MVDGEGAARRISQGIEITGKIIGLVGATLGIITGVVVWLIALEVRLERHKWENELSSAERARLTAQLEAERAINIAQAQALFKVEITVGQLNDKLQKAFDEVGIKRQ